MGIPILFVKAVLRDSYIIFCVRPFLKLIGKYREICFVVKVSKIGSLKKAFKKGFLSFVLRPFVRTIIGIPILFKALLRDSYPCC